MTFTQLVNPNPDITCQPGWCLQYVRQTFGAPIVEPTATAGWNNAKYRHENKDFPNGCYVPIWFSLATEPAGHVALLCPDGSVYSTSDNSTTPHHHSSLDDLVSYYAAGNPLTYRGWTEDISNVRVVMDTAMAMEGETMVYDPGAQWYADMIAAQARVDAKVANLPDNAQYWVDMINAMHAVHVETVDALPTLIANLSTGMTPENVDALADSLKKSLSADVVAELGKRLTA